MLQIMKLDLIVGARPNFMKIAPIIRAIRKIQNEKKKLDFRLIHTGQHYDKNMSESFFNQLNIPIPDINLNAGSGTQAEQAAAIMIGYEKILFQEKSDLCIVVGDVTSTMACAIVAKKMGIQVAHVEAGIRSGDWTMPEEINRIVTDSLTDYFFTTSEFANRNLRQSGVKQEKIFFVGNTMIDTLLHNRQNLRKPEIWDRVNLKEREYLLITLHRPANVDNENNLEVLLNEIIKHSMEMKLLFPVHPRTANVLKKKTISHSRLIITEPLGYLEFIYLVSNSKAVITDSGGITEETTVMNIPCITIRDNTERPETITEGTNELIGTDPRAIEPALNKLFKGNWKQGKIPKKWDGKAAERIVKVIVNTSL